MARRARCTRVGGPVTPSSLCDAASGRGRGGRGGRGGNMAQGGSPGDAIEPV